MRKKRDKQWEQIRNAGKIYEPKPGPTKWTVHMEKLQKE